MQNPIFVNTSRLYKTLCPYVALDPFKNNFIYSWLCWVFAAAWGFYQLLQAGAALWLWCAGFSLWWLLWSHSTGSEADGLQ